MAINSQTRTGLHTIKLFDKTVGLMDAVDSMRADAEAVTTAENVVVDVTGGVSRRAGTTLLSSGSWHSLFSVGKYGLGVRNGVIYVINSDLSLTSLSVTVGDERLSYVEVFDGTQSSVFYTSRSACGIVKGGSSHVAWTLVTSTVSNATQDKVREWRSTPFRGQAIEVFNGRMLVAEGNIFSYSELYNFSRYGMTSVYIFDSTITMLTAIETGVYVGTENSVFFLGGQDAEQFSLAKVYSSGSIAGTARKIPNSELMLPGAGSAVIFAVANEGICIGDGAGSVSNLTKIPVLFPSSNFGAGYINNDKQYIVSV